MANTTKKEEIEAKSAVAEVQKAEAKIEELKAEKAKKEAEKDAEILAKHPKIGSKINWVRHNKWKIAGTAATGGAFALGWFGHKFLSSKARGARTVEELDITPEEESETAPFNTEA